MTRFAFIAIALMLAGIPHAHAATLSPSQVASTGYGLATYQMDGGSTSVYIPSTYPSPVTGGFAHSAAYGGASVACSGGTVVNSSVAGSNEPPSGFYSNPGAYCADYASGGLTFTDLVVWHYYSSGSAAVHAYTSTGSIQTGFCVPGVGCASGSPTYTINYGAYTFHSTCSANYGTTCSVSNACGVQGNGTYSCSGACSATAPALPANYGQACTKTSAANSCGMTNTTSGTYGCAGACSAATPTVPSESLCAPTASCIMSPSSGYAGKTSFTYTATGAGGNGTYTYSWSGTDGLTGSTKAVSKTYDSTGSKTASVIVTSNGKSATAACTVSGGTSVTVNSCNPTLSASPTTIDLGQTTNLNWSVPAACASSCTFSDGHAVTGQSGTYPVMPPTPDSGTTVTYALTCPSSSSNTTQTAVTVRVPTVSISVAPDRVHAGDSSTVTWSSTNVDSCDITRNGTAWKAGLTADVNRQVNGTSPDTISTQTTYKITCLNDSGQTSAQATGQATVNLVPGFEEF